jgi:hypothetical protein
MKRVILDTNIIISSALGGALVLVLGTNTFLLLKNFAPFQSFQGGNF